VRRHFGNGRRARGDDRLAGGHGLQQHDAEAFLHARQAEEVRALVLVDELRAGDIAQPGDRACPSFSSAASCGASAGRTVPLPTSRIFEFGNARAQRGRRPQQQGRPACAGRNRPTKSTVKREWLGQACGFRAEQRRHSARSISSGTTVGNCASP
jgi:hypothetical protein